MKISESAIFKEKLATTKIVQSMLSTPTWSNSSTALLLTPFAESLLPEQYIVSNNYSVAQVSRDLWYMKNIIFPDPSTAFYHNPKECEF